MKWTGTIKLRQVLTLSRGISVCLSALFPIGYIANLPQIHWFKITSIYLLADDAVIWEGLGRDGSPLLHKVLVDQLDWGWRMWVASLTCLAPQLRCPEELGVGQANLCNMVAQGSKRHKSGAVRLLKCSVYNWHHVTAIAFCSK